MEIIHFQSDIEYLEYIDIIKFMVPGICISSEFNVVPAMFCFSYSVYIFQWLIKLNSVTYILCTFSSFHLIIPFQVTWGLHLLWQMRLSCQNSLQDQIYNKMQL